MKMKNEEEENQLLVQLFYDFDFHMSDSLILEHHQGEKIFQKYLFSKKI